jgi:hypothetical protein
LGAHNGNQGATERIKAMRYLATNRRAKYQDGTPAALQRSGQVALILGLSVCGMAGAYFLALYLVAH